MSLIKRIIDKTIIPVINYIYYNLPSTTKYSFSKPSVKQILFRMAKEDSAEYVKSFIRDVMVFESKEQIWDYSIKELSDLKGGNCLEFGVHKGRSINYFSERLNDFTFVGFDSFQGLAEEWKGHRQSAGHFNLHGELPKVNSNVELVKGFFDENISKKVNDITKKDRVIFVHIDCDTYPSSVIVLNEIKEILKPGILILFDDYFGYPAWRFGEFLALQEFIKENGLTYKYRAFSEGQALIEIV